MSFLLQVREIANPKGRGVNYRTESNVTYARGLLKELQKQCFGSREFLDFTFRTIRKYDEQKHAIEPPFRRLPSAASGVIFAKDITIDKLRTMLSPLAQAIDVRTNSLIFMIV